MDWLDVHNGAVQAVAAAIQVLVTGVLVAITIFYAVQTRRPVTAAQDALAAQFRPMLVPIESPGAESDCSARERPAETPVPACRREHRSRTRIEPRSGTR